MPRLKEQVLTTYDFPATEKIGDSCIDLGPLGKHCVPQIKTGMKRHEWFYYIDGPEDLRPAVEQCATSQTVLLAIAAFVAAPSTPTAVALAAAFTTCMQNKISVGVDQREHWL